VRLLRCDRVQYRRPSVLARKLEEEPGRIYRHFLVSGLSLTMNGRKVPARGPLCLLDGSAWTGGRQFGDTLVYRIPAFVGKGKISVRSANCPSINGTTFRRKRKRCAGSRARRAYRWCAQGREIDHGWFFMDGKRRENYDAWWRCEVSFDPVLDELFGITNSEQAISPGGELLDMLGQDLEPIARP
jgi:hypothetical protein